MASAVPDPGWGVGYTPLIRILGETLDGLLECTGATAGWVGLGPGGPGAPLHFPVRRGHIPDAWLSLQQGREQVWGFQIQDGPTLLNELPAWPLLGDPPLRNLLSCAFPIDKTVPGQIVLANKPDGFAAHDGPVLRAAVHLLARRLASVLQARGPRALVPDWLRLVLEKRDEGVVVLDEAGALAFANAAWQRLTGLSEGQLLGTSAPFRFWVSQRDLGTVSRLPPLRSQGILPFRRHDESLFWCQVQTIPGECDGRPMTLAFLRPLEGDPQSARPAGTHRSALPEPILLVACDFRLLTGQLHWLPLLLEPEAVVGFWDASWERLTGLRPRDLDREGGKVLLDWLFPRQPDRQYVADLLYRGESPRRPAQAVLDLVGPAGSQPLLCTFLPVGDDAGRRWLLLVGDPAARAAEDQAVQRFVDHLVGGLNQLLHRFLQVPLNTPELALAAGELPPDLASWFMQVLTSSLRATYLFTLAEGLPAPRPEAVRRVALEGVVRDCLAQPLASLAGPSPAEPVLARTQVRLEVPPGEDGVEVEVDLLARLLRQLLAFVDRTAFEGGPPAAVGEAEGLEVRVFARGEALCCALQPRTAASAGRRLTAPPPEWTAAVTPVPSLLGLLSQDVNHAALDASGLTLTLSRPVPALHGGRLSLRSAPGESPLLILTLARAGAVVRGDGPTQAAGPHALPETTPAESEDA